jgi:hypothetical protein
VVHLARLNDTRIEDSASSTISALTSKGTARVSGSPSWSGLVADIFYNNVSPTWKFYSVQNGQIARKYLHEWRIPTLSQTLKAPFCGRFRDRSPPKYTSIVRSFSTDDCGYQYPMYNTWYRDLDHHLTDRPPSHEAGVLKKRRCT